MTPFTPKLTPPRRRPDTIRRERLLRLLGDALEYDVIVVSAPAGYGKSTLIVDWIGGVNLPVAWLSLDRQDRDPLVLLRDLASAVRTIAPSALERFEGLLQSSGDRTDPEFAVSALGADIQTEIDEFFLLVIDDLNALEDCPLSVGLLDSFIQSTPLNVRVVLLTRSWTMLRSLPRLTAQRRAFTIAVRDMQFTDDEALDFVRRAGVTDEDQQLGVVRRADGWAAALAILAEHHDPNRPSGSGSASEFILADFIDDEVMSRLEPEHIDLLRACAILQSFDVGLVRDLSGHRDSARRLRELERATHLIVRLEDADWYRIHAILREHIIAEMERESADRLLELRRTASALYARKGMRREAVEMALQAGDWAEAVREIHELREDLYQQGEWGTLVDWLDRLPGEILNSEPELAMARARHALKLFDAHNGLMKIEAVQPIHLGAEQRARREVYRSVALRHMGQLTESVEACRLARSIARESLEDSHAIHAEIDLEEGIALGVMGRFPASKERLTAAASGFVAIRDHHRTAEAYDGLGLALGYLGSLPDALQALTAAQRLWRTLGDQRHQVSTMVNMGDIQRMMGELETARDTFNAVVQRSRDLRFVRGEAYGHHNLAIIEHDLGHLAAAASLYAIAIQSAGTFDDPSFVAAATCGLALVYREQDLLSRAKTLLEHGLRTADQGGMLLYRAWFRGALGAIRTDNGDLDEAGRDLHDALADAEASGDPKEQALEHFRLASLALRSRRRTDALAHLRQVAGLIESIGYDTFLWSEARQKLEVVEFAISRRVRQEYFRTLLDRCRRVLPDAPDAQMASPPVSQIRAEAFGIPRVVVAGRQISDLEWRSERSKEMFFFLLQSNRPLRKEQIAVELWPDVAPEHVNSAFHSTLYRLRRAIDKQVVVQSDDGYQVNDSYDIAYDAREFEEHMRAAEGGKAGSNEWSDHLAAALQLYRGPFAEPFESDWVQSVRQRYEDRYLTSLTALAAQAMRKAQYQDVIDLTQLALDIDQLDESAVRYQMFAHARGGHLELAAQTYRRYRDRVRSDRGEEPPSEIQDAYASVLSGAALDAQ